MLRIKKIIIISHPRNWPRLLGPLCILLSSSVAGAMFSVRLLPDQQYRYQKRPIGVWKNSPFINKDIIAQHRARETKTKKITPPYYASGSMVSLKQNSSVMQRIKSPYFLIVDKWKKLLQQSSKEVKVHSVQNPEQIISIAWSVAQKSETLMNMIEDLGGLSDQLPSIPLNYSFEQLSNVFYMLDPQIALYASAEERVQNYSLNQLVDSFNVLHELMIFGDVYDALKKEIIARIDRMSFSELLEKSTVVETINRDERLSLFIDPAIDCLKGYCAKKNIVDRNIIASTDVSSFLRAFSPNGKLIVMAANTRKGHSIQVLKDDLSLVAEISFSQERIDCLAWISDKSFIVATDQENVSFLNTFVLNNDGSVRDRYRVKVLQQSTIAIACSPNGKTVVSGGTGIDNLIVWKFNEDGLLDEVQKLQGDALAVETIVFSPDGTTMASCSRGAHNISMWPVNTDGSIEKKPHKLIEAQDMRSYSVYYSGLIAFSADSRSMLVADKFKGDLFLWSFGIDGKRTCQSIPSAYTSFSDLAFDKLGTMIFVSGRGKFHGAQFSLWPIRDKNVGMEQRINLPFYGFAVNFDGYRLVASTPTGVVLLALLNEEQKSMFARERSVMSVAQAVVIRKLSLSPEPHSMRNERAFDEIFNSLSLEVRSLLADDKF